MLHIVSKQTLLVCIDKYNHAIISLFKFGATYRMNFIIKENPQKLPKMAHALQNLLF
jgi:hypothetical protein